MNLRTASIAAELDAMQIPVESRGSLLSIAVARFLGYKLSLPSAPAESPYTFFDTTYLTQVEDILSDLNERIVVSFDDTVDMTRAIWCFRYRLLHECNNPAVRTFLDALIKVGTPDISPRVSETLIRYSQDESVERLCKIIGENCQSSVQGA
jgi:hypothetical protein